MESVRRNVSELSADERHVYEAVLGQPLQDHQRVVVRLEDATSPAIGPVHSPSAESDLKAFEIWADLSDKDVAELESAILQRSVSRPG